MYIILCHIVHWMFLQSRGKHSNYENRLNWINNLMWLNVIKRKNKTHSFHYSFSILIRSQSYQQPAWSQTKAWKWRKTVLAWKLRNSWWRRRCTWMERMEFTIGMFQSMWRWCFLPNAHMSNKPVRFRALDSRDFSLKSNDNFSAVIVMEETPNTSRATRR